MKFEQWWMSLPEDLRRAYADGGVHACQVAFNVGRDAALAAQANNADETPYPHLPNGLIVATRHDKHKKGATYYRAEYRNEDDRAIRGAWLPTRQAATAEAWSIAHDIQRRLHEAAQASGQECQHKQGQKMTEKMIEGSISEHVAALRELGCAVVVWQPNEIPKDADIDHLETLMIERGADYLEDFPEE